MLLGFGADAPVTFADVPVPDASRIAAMDLGTDTQAAVSANYDLMSVRANKATGSSNRTVKKKKRCLYRGFGGDHNPEPLCGGSIQEAGV